MLTGSGGLALEEWSRMPKSGKPGEGLSSWITYHTIARPTWADVQAGELASKMFSGCDVQGRLVGQRLPPGAGGRA